MNFSFLKHPNRYFPIFLTIAALFSFLGFGLVHLTKFETADEHYWLFERIPKYWKGWSEQKLERTLINDKPGISIALISGTGLLSEHGDPKEIRVIEKQIIGEGEDRDTNERTTYASEKVEPFLFAYRFPLLLTNFLLFALFGFLLFHLTKNIWIAASATILTSLSPILVGMSQIVNPDALFFSFGMCYLLALLVALEDSKKRYVVLAGFLLAAAILSKYVALLFCVVTPLIAFFHPIKKTPKESETKAFRKRFKKASLILIIALILLPIGLPALLVKPIAVLTYLTKFSATLPVALIGAFLFSGVVFLFSFFREKNTDLFLKKIQGILPIISKILAVFLLGIFILLLIGRNTGDFSVLKNVPFDIKYIDDISEPKGLNYDIKPWETILLEFNPILFSVTPILILLVLFFLAFIIFQKKQPFLSNPITILALAFIALFPIAQLFEGIVGTVRYNIILYPLFSILGAFALEILRTQFLRKKEFWYPGLLLIVFIASITSLFLSKPFYFNYQNNFLPKERITTDAWGYGGYEAAQYLNALPDAEHLTIWSDYRGVCPFFKGNCLTNYSIDEKTESIDYYVFTRRGKIRFKPEKRGPKENLVEAYKYYNKDPIWSLDIDNRPENFIRIVPSDPTFRVAIISDIDHCSVREVAPEKALREFVTFADKESVDFTISLGDNISHRLRNCSKTASEDLAYVFKELTQTLSPNYFVLGDHDIASSKASYDEWISRTGRNETFFSFDMKDVHVIILDTITGGEPLVDTCEEKPSCQKAMARQEEINKLLTKTTLTKNEARELKKELGDITRIIADETALIKYIHNAGKRDTGMILDRQLAWLKSDISSTKKEKVILFSDHPLFPFTSPRKSYRILNSEKVLSILEESPKKIVSISGEAQLWHEEERNGIQYFIMDHFKNKGGSWALFSWEKERFTFKKIP